MGTGHVLLFSALFTSWLNLVIVGRVSCSRASVGTAWRGRKRTLPQGQLGRKDLNHSAPSGVSLNTPLLSYSQFDNPLREAHYPSLQLLGSGLAPYNISICFVVILNTLFHGSWPTINCPSMSNFRLHVPIMQKAYNQHRLNSAKEEWH